MDITTPVRRNDRGARRAPTGALLVVVGWLAGACTGNPPPPAAAQACTPPDSSMLTAQFDAADLAGSYDLRIFADEGPGTGGVAEGRLDLRAYPEAERPPVGGVPASLHGTFDADLSPLGAADTGSTIAEAAEAPGALVLQWQAEDAERPKVLIRLGARSNRVDQVVFEGAYTVLRIYDAGDERFSGRWESGAPRLPAAGGRFCGVRVDE